MKDWHPTYKVLDRTADFAFEVEAPDLPGLVSSAVLAAADAMYQRPPMRPVEVVEVVLDARDHEMLIYRALSEFVYLVDARRLLVCGVEADELGDQMRLRFWCDTLDPTRHKPAVVFKAPTLHGLRVTKLENGLLRATVVMDT